MYNINDVYIGRSLDLYGEYSQAEVDIFDVFVKDGMLAIDVGANIGTHTVALANRVGKTGMVFGFESQRQNYYMLCGNIALNSIMNVEVLRFGLGNKEEVLKTIEYDPSREGNFGGISFSERGNPVMIKRLDDFGLVKCDFIKIDVEGMERKVLEGGENTIKRFMPVLYVENNMKGDPSLLHEGLSLINYITYLGYDCYWHYPPIYNEDNYLGNSENVFPNIASHNMLCLPSGTPFDLLEKVQNSPSTVA